MLDQLSFSLAVIDLDNTLYAADNGVFARMDQRMNAYICRELKLTPAQANTMRIQYWQQYGSTLKGLMLHHQQQAEPFLHEVHDINAHELLQPNPDLSQTLAALPMKKVIHTNGTRQHAEDVLSALAIRHHFSASYDIRFHDYTPKPCASTLIKLFQQEDVVSHQVLVIDDMQDNLKAAQQVGAQTAWVHQDAAHSAHPWDIGVTSFTQLLPQTTP